MLTVCDENCNAQFICGHSWPTASKNYEEKRKNWNDLRNKNGIVSIIINYYSKKSEFPLRASFQIFLITLGI